jgi:hypothetical protein
VTAFGAMTTAGPAVEPPLEERLHLLEEQERLYGLSPDGKKMKADVERQLMQRYAEETSDRAEVEAQLRVADTALQERLTQLQQELQIFTGIAEEYVEVRSAYDVVAKAARKSGVSFEPVPRFENLATANSDEGRSLRRLLTAFKNVSMTRW